MSRRSIKYALVSVTSIGIFGMSTGAASATVKTQAPATVLACLDAKGGLVMPTKDACPKGLRAIHLPLTALQGS